MNKVTVQKIGKQYDKNINKALAYYTLLLSLNNIKLQKRELELLAFMSIRGTITTTSARKEFCETFDTSLAHTENLKTALIKRGFIVKDDKMYRVNPEIAPNFDNPVILQITLK